MIPKSTKPIPKSFSTPQMAQIQTTLGTNITNTETPPTSKTTTALTAAAEATTAEQRIRQSSWRKWTDILDLLSTLYLAPNDDGRGNDDPGNDGQSSSNSTSSQLSIKALDLGCGTGEVTSLMSSLELYGWDAMGIDGDIDMINAARQNHPSTPFIQGSITSLSRRCLSSSRKKPADQDFHNDDDGKTGSDLSIPRTDPSSTISPALMHQQYDILWSSFAVQYFMDDFLGLISMDGSWNSLLRPGGLLALVETNGLFQCHQPQSPETTNHWKSMEDTLRNDYGYDTSAGQKLHDMVLSTGQFEILYETNSWDDPEFAFDGPASSQILEAWSGRLDRMKFPKQYFSDAQKFQQMKDDFLECLANPNHTTTTGLTIIIARKKY